MININFIRIMTLKSKIHLRYIFNFRDDCPILIRIIYIIIRRISEKWELKNIYNKIKIFILFFLNISWIHYNFHYIFNIIHMFKNK